MYVYICVCICVYMCVYMGMNMYVYICVFVCVYIYMCVCMCMYQIRSVKDIMLLNFSWELACQYHHYKTNAVDFVAHLIGHEGKGSVLSALKERGLANTLLAGCGCNWNERTSSYFLFNIEINLTMVWLLH